MQKTTDVCLKCVKQDVCKYQKEFAAIVQAVNTTCYSKPDAEQGEVNSVDYVDWVELDIRCKRFVEAKINVPNFRKDN